MLEAKNFVALAPDNETKILFHFLCLKDSFFIYISTVSEVGGLEDLHVGMPPMNARQQRPAVIPPVEQETSSEDQVDVDNLLSKTTASKLRLTTVDEDEKESRSTSTGGPGVSVSDDTRPNKTRSTSALMNEDVLPQPASCLLGCVDSLGSSLASQLAQFFGMPMHVSCNIEDPQLSSSQGDEYGQFYLFLLSQCRDFIKKRVADAKDQDVEAKDQKASDEKLNAEAAGA
ncbi:unnamed protein product [Amoebophrya sp. A25]|nr:unnamed protein product [Amoebophrya sp. A25]|eukprot:GSA25T00003813001.1